MTPRLEPRRTLDKPTHRHKTVTGQMPAPITADTTITSITSIAAGVSPAEADVACRPLP